MKPIYLIRSYRNVPGLQISQPMGILYLAAYIRKELNLSLKLIDMRLRRKQASDVVAEMENDEPLIIGISALSFEAEIVHELAALAKIKFPAVPIVVGGPYATTEPEAVVNDSNIDYAVVGEGELTFKELVEAILGGNKHPSITGTVIKQAGEVIFFPNRAYISDINSLPLPAWDLINLSEYFGKTNFNRIYAHKANMTIMTSRGCPFKCAYCHNVFGSRFRARSPESVLEEMKILYNQYGIREYLIIDDTFNLNRVRAKKICDMLLEENLNIKISFPNGLKADVMDKELIGKLKACGTYRICYGVESASERILKLITRQMNIEKTKAIIEETARASILTHGFFMLGFPTETEKEMMTTINFALNSRLHTASFFVVVPFSGTRLASLVENTKDSGYIDGFYHHIDNVISAIPPDRVKYLVKYAYRKFYSKPYRLYNIFKLTPKNIDFVRSSLEFLSRAK